MLGLDLILLALLQGVSELFPISSLGHSVLVPALLHWPIDREATWFLPYVVVLHLGTALALLIFFRREWLVMLGAVVRSRGSASDPHTRLFWLLVCGSLPAGILGLLLEHRVQALFGGFTVAAVFLMLNGLLLMLGDRLKQRTASRPLEQLPWGHALLIGCAQALALVPGISRSGVTLVAGLVGGLDYAASARYSFLLATPIIGAAGLLEVPKLLRHGQALPAGLLPIIFFGGIVAAAAAWLSTWFLMRYFRTHEIRALRPFGVYCLAAGALALMLHSL